MWETILIIGVILLVLCLILMVILKISTKKYQQKIDNGGASLLSSIHNIDRDSSRDNIEQIKDRINYVENKKKLQDYTVEIAEYKSYVKILRQGDYESTQAAYLNKLINLLRDRTNQYKAYNRVNKFKENIQYELNIDDNLNNLMKIYNDKEMKVKRLISKKFPAPQLTYDRLMSSINDWNAVFKENSENLIELLDLDSKYTAKYQDEITFKLSLIKGIIDKMGELEVELVINMDKEKNDDKIKEIFEDMNSVVESIKDYK